MAAEKGGDLEHIRHVGHDFRLAALVNVGQNRHTEAGSASARARDQAEAWREAHKVQAWLHDKGIGHAAKLRETS